MNNTPDSEFSILVVDDTETNVDILLEILSDKYDVSVAIDGPTALEIAFESPPDLILLDIMMPGMDGYEVCSRLKKDERTRDIPVIFVTAMGEMVDEIKGFDIGAVDYITKPINPSVVQARVSAHLKLQYKTRQLLDISNKLSKYLSPQVYSSIFSGEQEARIESKRKKLTVFFSDIVGFTRTTEDMESEDLSRLLNSYLEEMSNIALKHGGTIDKFIGDAILIFFGDPLSRGEKEDALECVSMALEMRQRMQELHKRWYQYGFQEPFRIRMGISTGYCTVGNFGSRNRMDYTIIGSRVNLASRLESSASPDQILISHETWSLVRDRVYCFKQRPVSVKGIAHPVQSYQVVDYLENMSTDEHSRTIGFLAENVKTVAKSLTVRDLQASSDRILPLEMAAVVVENDVPVGLIMGYHLLKASRSEVDLTIYYEQSVSTIMDSEPLVMEMETPFRQAIGISLIRKEEKRQDPIIITSEGKCTGIVKIPDAMKMLMQITADQENDSDLMDDLE